MQPDLSHEGDLPGDDDVEYDESYRQWWHVWPEDDTPEWEVAVSDDIEVDDHPVAVASCVSCCTELSEGDACFACWCLSYADAGRRAESEPDLGHGFWYLACWARRLCAICGVNRRVSRHRCDTCRKYFDRNGRERPRRLSDRQPLLNVRNDNRNALLDARIATTDRLVRHQRDQQLEYAQRAAEDAIEYQAQLEREDDYIAWLATALVDHPSLDTSTLEQERGVEATLWVATLEYRSEPSDVHVVDAAHDRRGDGVGHEALQPLAIGGLGRVRVGTGVGQHVAVRGPPAEVPALAGLDEHLRLDPEPNPVPLGLRHAAEQAEDDVVGVVVRVVGATEFRYPQLDSEVDEDRDDARDLELVTECPLRFTDDHRVEPSARPR